MKNLKTSELVFILDKSGSMRGLESDTIGGFNALLKNQKTEPGRARVTTVLFDNSVKTLHDHIDIRHIPKMGSQDYEVGGCTALLDAIGQTLTLVMKRQKECPKEIGNTVVAIMTDGLENSSREYDYKTVRNLISRLEERGWIFMFLGANIDAPEVAGRLGIQREMAANYHGDSIGTRKSFDGLSMAMSDIRCCGEAAPEWRREIDHDYEERI